MTKELETTAVITISSTLWSAITSLRNQEKDHREKQKVCLPGDKWKKDHPRMKSTKSKRRDSECLYTHSFYVCVCIWPCTLYYIGEIVFKHLMSLYMSSIVPPPNHRKLRLVKSPCRKQMWHQIMPPLLAGFGGRDKVRRGRRDSVIISTIKMND